MLVTAKYVKSRTDTFVDDKALETYEDYKEQFQALSHSTSIDKSAAPKALELFSQMMDQYLEDEDEHYKAKQKNKEDEKQSLRPTTEIYNLVLNTLAYSRTNHYQGALRAESILESMENASEEYLEEIGAPPNVISYIAVMDGFIHRKQPQKVNEIFLRLKQRHEETTSEHLKPNTSVYNRMIKAYMVNADRDKSAPRKVEAIYKEMVTENIPPNSKTFAQRILTHCYANSPRTQTYPVCVKAQEIFDSMLELYNKDQLEQLKPNTLVYNALIRSYAQSAREKKDHRNKKNDDVQDEIIENAPSKAESILSEMIKHYQNGDESVAPDGASFINAMNAWSKSNSIQSAPKVMKLLDMMIELHEKDGNANAKPTVQVYNAVLNTISRSKEEGDGDKEDNAGKAQKAKELLSQLRNSEEPEMKPNLRSYNLVMSACAFSRCSTSTSRASTKAKANVCKIAIETFNELRSDNSSVDDISGPLKPDHITYGMFLKVCGKFMPKTKRHTLDDDDDDDDMDSSTPGVSSNKRENVIENIFRKCCADGMVNEFVISEFSKAASKDLRMKMLGTYDVRGMKMKDLGLPVEWSKNAVE